MSIWDSFAKDAETGTGGEIPDIPNDLYNATIKEVTEPRDVADIYNEGKMKTQFVLKWRLDSDDFDEEVVRFQYVTLPPLYINEGVVHEKSDLFEIMTALGYDMNGQYRVDPREWVGKQARVMIENKQNKKGEMVPRITGVQAPRRKKTTEEKRQPVGANAGKTIRERAYETDDDDD